MTPEDINQFWFEQIKPKQWFEQNDALDALIRDRFWDVFCQARAGELYKWRETPKGALAEIIILDQFSRNLFRDDPRAYDQDGMALTLAQRAVEKGMDKILLPVENGFLYMPFMHSESLAIHEEFSLPLFKSLGVYKFYPAAVDHYETIKQYGRYPKRVRHQA